LLLLFIIILIIINVITNINKITTKLQLSGGA